MSKNNIIKYKIKATVLSPVLIGNGNILNKMDFIIDHSFLKLCDIENIPINEDKLFLSIEKYSSLKDILLENKIILSDIEYRNKIGINCREENFNKIIEQIKDVNNNPYIPGSSIKGSIRTAFLYYFLENDNNLLKQLSSSIEKSLDNARGKKDIFKNAEKTLFGGDPTTDIFKCISISDSSPMKSDHLKVEEIKTVSIDNNQKYKWKVFGKNPNTSDIDIGTSIYIEAIQEETNFKFDIIIDSYLLNEAHFNKHMIKEILLDKNKFIDVLFSYSGNKYNEEVEFIEKYGIKNNKKLYNNYMKIYKKEDDERRFILEDDEFLLPIGYGTGQGLKTVFSLLDKKLQERLRFELGLGKIIKGKLIFPYSKTRKCIIRNGEPLYPLGWIKCKLEEVYING
jgi:CRISPR type III-A-associated RAMP protein Csm5